MSTGCWPIKPASEFEQTLKTIRPVGSQTSEVLDRWSSDRAKTYGEDFAMIAVQREQSDGASEKPAPRRMLNEKQVLQIVPVGRTTLYRMEKAGRFPKSTYISPNRRVWFADEIIAWQNAVDEFNPTRGRGKGRRVRAVTAFGGKAATG